MPGLDAVRVRVLLEQLCELEPAFRRVGKEQFKFDLGEGKAWCYLSDNHAIRDALEALHDARGWTVTLSSASFKGDANNRHTECAIGLGEGKGVHAHGFTRLEAMLEATNTALGGAS